MPQKSRFSGSGLDYFLVSRLSMSATTCPIDFETGERPSGWSGGTVATGASIITTEAQAGAVLCASNAEGRDWALSNVYSIAAQPGEYYLLTDGARRSLALSRPSASSARKMARWRIGRNAAMSGAGMASSDAHPGALMKFMCE